MIVLLATLYQHLYHQAIWEELQTPPFTELILSWNTTRPAAGRFTFFVSVQENSEWSPWLYFGEWGCDGQMLFIDEPEGSNAKVRQGRVFCNATGFRVQTIATGGAELNNLMLSVATNSPLVEKELPTEAVLLPHSQRQSQITLRHPRYADLALPTAMTVAINTILKSKVIDASHFAANVYDGDFDYYESLPLSVAEAGHHLWPQISVHAERLPNFNTLHAHLMAGFPVVALLKGTLTGAPRPFYIPHAVCVIGYDPAAQTVICIDPFFPNDRATQVAYSISDFLTAWKKQNNLSVIFQRNFNCSR